MLEQDFFSIVWGEMRIRVTVVVERQRRQFVATAGSVIKISILADFALLLCLLGTVTRMY